MLYVEALLAVYLSCTITGSIPMSTHRIIAASSIMSDSLISADGNASTFLPTNEGLIASAQQRTTSDLGNVTATEQIMEITTYPTQGHLGTHVASNRYSEQEHQAPQARTRNDEPLSVSIIVSQSEHERLRIRALDEHDENVEVIRPHRSGIITPSVPGTSQTGLSSGPIRVRIVRSSHLDIDPETEIITLRSFINGMIPDLREFQEKMLEDCLNGDDTLIRTNEARQIFACDLTYLPAPWDNREINSTQDVTVLYNDSQVITDVLSHLASGLQDECLLSELRSLTQRICQVVFKCEEILISSDDSTSEEELPCVDSVRRTEAERSAFVYLVVQHVRTYYSSLLQ